MNKEKRYGIDEIDKIYIIIALVGNKYLASKTCGAFKSKEAASKHARELSKKYELSPEKYSFNVREFTVI